MIAFQLSNGKRYAGDLISDIALGNRITVACSVVVNGYAYLNGIAVTVSTLQSGIGEMRITQLETEGVKGTAQSINIVGKIDIAIIFINGAAL